MQKIVTIIMHKEFRTCQNL